MKVSDIDKQPRIDIVCVCVLQELLRRNAYYGVTVKKNIEMTYVTKSRLSKSSFNDILRGLPTAPLNTF
jgi:hypothetical protein